MIYIQDQINIKHKWLDLYNKQNSQITAGIGENFDFETRHDI